MHVYGWVHRDLQKLQTKAYAATWFFTAELINAMLKQAFYCERNEGILENRR